MKKIHILPYNPNWPDQYRHEAELIKTALKDRVIDLHHIGSTSVPGLAAKQDLDILLVIDDFRALETLKEISYSYKGELNIPLRFFFSKNTEEAKVNLHVCEQGHAFIPLQLTFRDWLRNHDDDRQAYENLKFEILKSNEAHQKIKGGFSLYGAQKDTFIKKILKKSGYDKLIVNFCFHNKECEEAEKFRSKHKEPSANISSWSFHNEKNKHLVLYDGVEIVGYAHVEFDLNTRETIRCLAIKDNNKYYRAVFSTFLKEWLLYKEKLIQFLKK